VAGDGGSEDGIMVAVFPPSDVAQVLAGGGPDDEPADQLHVTLAYLGTTDEFTPEQIDAMRRAVAQATSHWDITEGTVQGIGEFEADPKPYWYAVDAPGLAAIRTDVVQRLSEAAVPAREDHDFTPHMTIRYGGERPEGIPPGGESPWPITNIVLAVGNEHEAFTLGVATPAVDEDPAANMDPLDTYTSTEGNDMPEPITASGAAEFSPDMTYFWDPDANITYRVGADDAVEMFGAEGSWGPADITSEDANAFPTVDDPETLEALVGSALAEITAIVAAAVAVDPDVIVPEGAGAGTGRKFRIPIVIPEGVPSGDRRQFAMDALEFKEPPMPLLWQKITDEGHKQSVIVGKIMHVERLEAGGLGNAEGVFDSHPDALEAARQVKERFLTGVSGDVDKFQHELSTDDDGGESMLIKHGRLVAATLVAKPAFQEATIEIVPEEGEVPAIVASAGPLFPPTSWFEMEEPDGPTPLTVDDDGRVYGHIAEWGTPHLGNPKLKPPHSPSGYRYFNRKPLRTQEGADVKVGQLTLIGGHASLDMDPAMSVKHYDDTRSAVADVRAKDGKYGVFVCGAMRSDISPEQIRAFRASEPSGDWRKRDGKLDLVACCQVNVAGFPVNARPRALVASGEVIALVAAGMVGHAAKYESMQSRLDELQNHVTVLISERDARIRAEAIATIETLKSI